ncbi:MAG: tetratricopeptide repeat protein [Polyangiaceae bacterium]|nr:tetratricopeptide repeat protein [Polyangiaceae bacterium]
MKTKDQSGTNDTGKVIHVIFGPGGGRVSTPPSAAAQERDEPPQLASAPGREPVTETFTASEVTKLLGLSPTKLRALDRAGVVVPTALKGKRRAYTFPDVIALRAARDLFDKRVKLREVLDAVQNLKRALPKVTRPLAELRVVSDGRRMVVKGAAGPFEPATGQMLLDFDVKDLRDDVVRVLKPSITSERAKTAYDVYTQASRLDEDPATMDEAEALYRKAVELDPSLAIAYTNLGNVCFRRGDEAAAEALYRRALTIDATQPEAQYNLGYVMLERGQAREAIEFFKGALKSDPRFADAYFNLAMAYEQVEEPAKARPCWRKYLEIEPTGTWAEIARRHL